MNKNFYLIYFFFSYCGKGMVTSMNSLNFGDDSQQHILYAYKNLD